MYCEVEKGIVLYYLTYQLAMTKQLDLMAGRMPLRHLLQQLLQRRLQQLATLVAVGCWTEHSLSWPTFAVAMGIFNRKKVN
jgi:hypothetical protein